MLNILFLNVTLNEYIKLFWESSYLCDQNKSQFWRRQKRDIKMSARFSLFYIHKRVRIRTYQGSNVYMSELSIQFNVHVLLRVDLK